MARRVYEFELESNGFCMQSTSEMEKQISVDPISLILPRIVTGPMLPPPSPRFGSWMKKKLSHASSRQFHHGRSLRKCSTIHPHHHHGNETRLRRSKSCAEGRSSGVDELDIWFKNPDEFFVQPGVKSSSYSSSSQMAGTKRKEEEEEFKCGALCLYLPGFGGGGKVKPERERKEEVVVSRTVSMEKFECGSWASSAIMAEESTRFYYDLPMEMIRTTGGSEMDSPVTAAFVFEKDRKGVLKKNGCTTPNRKSEDSSSARQVRFSRSSSSSSASNPSSPAMCITPRLRKAREEFNAFLEAEARTS